MRSPSILLFSQGYFLIHFTTASTNSGVKVIFSPSRFSNSFLIFSRHCTILVTSASVKLVTCAEVCLLSTMCLAIILRIRSISTISTLPLYDVVATACLAGVSCTTVAGWFTTTGCAAATGAGVALPAFLSATYCNISFLVTRPSLPVPGMFSSSLSAMPSLAAIFSTRGE